MNIFQIVCFSFDRASKALQNNIKATKLQKVYSGRGGCIDIEFSALLRSKAMVLDLDPAEVLRRCPS